MSASTAESRTGVQAPEPVILASGTLEAAAVEPDTYQLVFEVKVDKPTRIGAAAAEISTELTVVLKTETSSLRKSLSLHDDDNDNDGWKEVGSVPLIIERPAGTVRFSQLKVEFRVLKYLGDFPVVVRNFKFIPCV